VTVVVFQTEESTVRKKPSTRKKATRKKASAKRSKTPFTDFIIGLETEAFERKVFRRLAATFKEIAGINEREVHAFLTMDPTRILAELNAELKKAETRGQGEGCGPQARTVVASKYPMGPFGGGGI
jgi:hypothetical protein